MKKKMAVLLLMCAILLGMVGCTQEELYYRTLDITFEKY